MKTAEEWVKERATTKGVLGNLTVNIARSIQSDALREAAEIADRTEFIYDSQAGADLRMRNKIRDAILAKAKELC